MDEFKPKLRLVPKSPEDKMEVCKNQSPSTQIESAPTKPTFKLLKSGRADLRLIDSKSAPSSLSETKSSRTATTECQPAGTMTLVKSGPKMSAASDLSGRFSPSPSSSMPKVTRLPNSRSSVVGVLMAGPSTAPTLLVLNVQNSRTKRASNESYFDDSTA